MTPSRTPKRLRRKTHAVRMDSAPRASDLECPESLDGQAAQSSCARPVFMRYEDGRPPLRLKPGGREVTHDDHEYSFSAGPMTADGHVPTEYGGVPPARLTEQEAIDKYFQSSGAGIDLGPPSPTSPRYNRPQWVRYRAGEYLRAMNRNGPQEPKPDRNVRPRQGP
eukprot:jgi/Mesvir1/1508/Mv14491-RA.1